MGTICKYLKNKYSSFASDSKLVWIVTEAFQHINMPSSPSAAALVAHLVLLSFWTSIQVFYSL